MLLLLITENYETMKTQLAGNDAYNFHTNFDENWPPTSNIQMGTPTHVQPTFIHFMRENKIEYQKNSFN
jgi:hypothetical protein